MMKVDKERFLGDVFSIALHGYSRNDMELQSTTNYISLQYIQFFINFYTCIFIPFFISKLS